MKRYFPLLFLLPLLPLAACETAIDVPEPPHTPRIALNYVLTSNPADTSFAALLAEQVLYVSNSQRVFDRGYLQGRRDATVEIRDGSGAVVERFRPTAEDRGGNYSAYPTGPGYYRPTLGLVPRPGTAYTLRATVPGFEAAESNLTFPALPRVTGGSYAVRPGSSSSSEHRGRLTLTIPDDPAAANYYIAYAQLIDAQGQPLAYSTLNVDYDSQNSSAGIGQFQLSSPQQRYSIEPFADTGANGQVLTLSADTKYYDAYCPGAPGNACPPPAFVEVTVSAITADTYQFYLSRRRYYDASGNPFAEPAPLASNLRNGYGLFGASADTKYRLAL